MESKLGHEADVCKLLTDIINVYIQLCCHKLEPDVMGACCLMCGDKSSGKNSSHLEIAHNTTCLNCHFKMSQWAIKSSCTLAGQNSFGHLKVMFMVSSLVLAVP